MGSRGPGIAGNGRNGGGPPGSSRLCLAAQVIRALGPAGLPPRESQEPGRRPLAVLWRRLLRRSQDSLPCRARPDEDGRQHKQFPTSQADRFHDSTACARGQRPGLRGSSSCWGPIWSRFAALAEPPPPAPPSRPWARGEASLGGFHGRFAPVKTTISRIPPSRGAGRGPGGWAFRYRQRLRLPSPQLGLHPPPSAPLPP